MPAKPRRPGRRGGGKRRGGKASRLFGIMMLVVGIILAGIYLKALDYSRPHVAGDALRFDTFINMVLDGRIRDTRILDEDAYVVGVYGQADPGHKPVPFQAPGGHHGSFEDLARANTPRPLPPLRRYKVPLVRGYQADLVNGLLDNGVPITVDQQAGKRVAALAGLLLPGLIITLLFIYLIISYRRGSGLFGIRSGARRVRGGESDVTFADVAGQDAAVLELREIRDFLLDPARYVSLGAVVPKGLLLYGPPGCGKTLMAKALAGESGANFYSVSGSDFVEVYVGVGAARVRDLFREARAHAPAVIFIDELDSIGRTRGVTGATVSHGEQEQSLNQILAEMDGFSTTEGIIVVAATNRPDILDPALLRPGRFDRTVGLERPSEQSRLAILDRHARDKRLDAGVDLGAIASRAIGLTGADLASVLNEGALLAGRAGHAAISQDDLVAALARVLDAPERQRRLSLRARSIGRRYASDERVTFSDVAGVDGAVAELREISQFLAEPERFRAVGARPPRGILLSGPPGCGKTLLARAVAGESNAAFISVAGSEFVEVWVGEGASRVRELFAEARGSAPAIVFFDELDSLGTARGMSHGERDQTLNQLLVELDGFETRDGLMVMAATNRPDMLDSALTRPGRIDRHVSIEPPDRAGRRAILELHARGKPLDDDVDLDRISGLTRGLSGADLANVLNEAALLAARVGARTISMVQLDAGIDRALLGVAGRSTVMDDEERRVVAYHECGHAMVALALPGAVAPHRLTIVATSATLGHCTHADDRDRQVYGRSRLLDWMATLLGGWVAEGLMFGETGAGCASDLGRAEKLARRMVAEYGMTARLGPRTYESATGGVRHSEQAARTIDAEVDLLLEEARARAHAVLAGDRATLDRIAAALLARESLTAADLDALVAGSGDAVGSPSP